MIGHVVDDSISPGNEALEVSIVSGVSCHTHILPAGQTRLQRLVTVETIVNDE